MPIDYRGTDERGIGDRGSESRGIDYRGLVTGLAGLAKLIGTVPELVAVASLVDTLCEATGAIGGTFTEYSDGGGRVVVAQGTLTWALGRAVAPHLVQAEIIALPFAGPIESMPSETAGPLRARGVAAVVGHPVRAGGRVAGALHLYFADLLRDLRSGDAARGRAPDSTAVMEVLQTAATFAASFYTGREAMPVRTAEEEDDRSLFLAVAGHELRTPVTVIKGYASLLADRWDSLDDEQRRSAARVLTQRADELARLVDRLLGTSVGDPRSGTLVRTVPFDPLTALMQAANMMPSEIRRTVRLQLPNWLPPASGDPDVIGTVVTELVTNAVRASECVDPQPASVDVTAGADADTVYIRVLDRGVGISPAEAERAFERFWRGSRRPAGGDAEARNGVGLGLYLVRRLVERQNGWVSLRPRDGGGTIAEVRLARADAPPRPATPQA
jgi:signal transduction histidine kinase